MERWELDNASISMLDISTQSIIRHERQVAQRTLMEYLCGACDTHEPPIRFINYTPQVYRWGCKQCQNELTKYFEIDDGKPQ